MGMIQQLAAILFGGNRNAVKELAEVFRVNAEASAERGHALDTAALSQFAAEFVARNQRTWWDSLVDGLNRLPRPAFTCGVFAVLIWTVRDPVFMSEVFTAWAVERAQFFARWCATRKGAWAHPAPERDLAPGKLVLGDLAKISWVGLPDTIHARGINPATLNKAILRQARLPRAVAQEQRYAA